MFRILSRQVVGLFIAAALASFAAAPAHAGTLTLSGLSCTSLVVGGSQSQGWTVSCTSVTCSLQASNSNPAPGSSITLTPFCDSGATNYTFATPTGGCTTPAANGIVSESAAKNCTYQVTGSNAGNTLQGQATTAVSWSTGTPAAPTGCSESGNPTTFTAAGGTINLSASCATPASGIVWSWTRNGAGGWSAAQNPSEALPANGTSSAAPYTYQAKACNGSDSFGGANCTIITPQVSASVAGSGGGGGGAINCAAVPGSGVSGSTQVLDLDWFNPLTTARAVGLSQTDAVVVRITMGPAGGYGQISGAEFGGSSAGRFAVLSATPCDFSYPPPLGWGATSIGNTVGILFANGDNPYGYPSLTPNATAYFNLRTTGACGGNCGMLFQLNRY